MPTDQEDLHYYTVEVASDLPLAEQIHMANLQLCYDVSSNEKVFLEDITIRNGHKILRYRFWRDEPRKKLIMP